MVFDIGSLGRRFRKDRCFEKLVSGVWESIRKVGVEFFETVL
jgi:hypothetical protein